MNNNYLVNKKTRSENFEFFYELIDVTTRRFLGCGSLTTQGTDCHSFYQNFAMKFNYPFIKPSISSTSIGISLIKLNGRPVWFITTSSSILIPMFSSGI